MVECPLCDSPLGVEEDELDEGDTLVCEECGANIRVNSLDPLELEEVEDDFGDEEDEEFEEDEDDPWRGSRRY
jgi:alpha-aminoadipate carrier protein LysW